MHLRSLRLVDYRSWPSLDLRFGPGTTVLVGRNGHGKTNVLEAITLLATGKSHRVSGDAPLVRSGREGAIVTALAHNSGRELQVELAVNKGKANRARLNTSPVRSPRQLLGVVQSVIFAPEDLSLVRGDPSGRRAFLDDLAVQRRPRLAALRAEYDKVVRQRTALLKNANAAERRGRPGGGFDSALASIEVWDVRLAELGAQIIAARAGLVAELDPLVTEAYAGIAPESRAARIAYEPRLRGAAPGLAELRDPEFMEAVLLAEIAGRREDEVARAQTLVGPHRDELALRLGDEPAKGFASHGETWSFALALRIASLELLRADDLEPILLLDDVFAELDTARRAALAEIAAGVEQVFVTAAVPEDLPPALSGSLIHVEMAGEGDARASRIREGDAAGVARDAGVNDAGNSAGADPSAADAADHAPKGDD
ncbi:DNA replication/repair protein RecF [Dietzia sp.]|uniref:DNA replication/repair protein RecF n=1 Tax=Dietzia sp. TaxID=1871616 RepID=UPI002FDA6C88